MSDERADLHLLYQVTAQDLAYFKTQQWSVTNYAFLGYGALVAVKAMLTAYPIAVPALILIAMFLGVTAIALLWRLERSIQGRRARLTAVRSKLSTAFNDVWSVMDKSEPTYLVPVWVLTIALIIGASLAIWAVA